MENKTVEVDGMVYEIGKWYEFSNEDNWEVSKLDAVEGSNFVFLTSLGWMRFCREVKLSVGTITPAPVKLIDGEAYELDYIAGKFIGIYDKKENIFHLSHNRTINFNLAANITRLVPEVK